MSKKRVDALELKEIDAWLQEVGGDYKVWDFLSIRAGTTLAVAFSELFWPRFVEVEGCVFLRENYERHSFERWREQFSGEIRRIEGMVNHVHLWDLFDSEEEEMPEAALEGLAEIIGLCWQGALRYHYPTRDFEVVVAGDEEGEYGPTITFMSSEESS